MQRSVLTMVMRVMLVEDHEPFRRFISATLQAQEHLHVIDEQKNGLDAVVQAGILKPDLMVLDIGLPGLNGIEAARRIRDCAPGTKIIFLSQESSADIVQEALNAGALGYVIKTEAENELLDAIESVLEGKIFLSSGVRWP